MHRTPFINFVNCYNKNMKRFYDIAPAIILAAIVLVVGFSRSIEQKDPNLGASLDVPTVVALFETSLASAISSTATSFTLTSAADLTGTALASSTYAFIIDEGSSSQELVIADCTGTTCANAIRGVSVVTGTTTVAALEHSHRRGASVKITDGPQLNILSRIVNGVGTFPNVLSYKTAPTFTSGNQIITKTYADNLIIAGGTAGSNSVPGIFLTATGLQAASSTPSGTYLGQPYLYVIPASVATDTPTQSTASGSKVVVSAIGGYIKQAWINLTEAFTVSGAWIFNGTATFNSSAIFNGSETHTSSLTVATTTTSTNFIGKNFGGTGADGTLNCTTATTTIDIGSASIIEKNYSSISITGTCGIEFSNPANGGSIVIFKSQGNTTITTTGQIYLRNIGGVNGTADATQASAGNGYAGGGGASATAAGSNGANGSVSSASTPTAGTGFGRWIYGATSLGGGSIATGGCNSASAGGVGGTSPALATTNSIPNYLRAYILPGSGGAGGCGGDTSGGSNGGRGAGAFYMEVGGNLNITSTINAGGTASAATADSTGGCGGGGGGGSIQILYNYLTANSGTYTVAGGASGGTCAVQGGAGANGYSNVSQNTFF